MHTLDTVAIPSHPLALMLSSSSLSIDNVGFRLPLQPLLSRAQELIAVVVVVVVFLTHPPPSPLSPSPSSSLTFGPGFGACAGPYSGG